MRLIRGGLLITFAVWVGLFAGASAAGAAAVPIGPKQHFVAFVKGLRANAVVYTVCGGPTTATQQGHIAGGQNAWVAQGGNVSTVAGGDTGVFDVIHAWFVPATVAPVSGPTAPVEMTFTTYNTAKAMPTTMTVPCNGAGRMEFSSCPYLAPCAAGWVPTYVTVKFVDLAVTPTPV